MLLLTSLYGNANNNSSVNEEEQIKLANSHLQKIETLKNQTKFISYYIDKVKNSYLQTYCYPQSAAESLATYGIALNERFSTELNIQNKHGDRECVNVKTDYRESKQLTLELTLALQNLSSEIKSNLAVLASIKISNPDSKAAAIVDSYFKNETKSLNSALLKKWGITTKQIGLGLLVVIFGLLIFSGLAMVGGMPFWVLGITLGSVFGAYFSAAKIADLSNDKDNIKKELQLSNDLIKEYKNKLIKIPANTEDFKVELSISP